MNMSGDDRLQREATRPRMLARSLGLALILIAVVSGGTGCQRGLRIGGWQVIGPKPPLYATRIEVRCGVALVARNEAPASMNSHLTVDLVSGRASLAEEGGDTHPVEIDSDMIDTLRAGIADRSWQVKEIRPAQQLPRALVYEMTVFVGAEAVEPSARWHMPADKDVPETLGKVTVIFNDAARSVDPLSKRFDLLD